MTQPQPAPLVDIEELERQAKGDLAGAAKFRNHIPSTPVPTLALLDIIQELRALRAERSWIRCSERMPEEGRAVLFSNPLWAEPELGRFVDEGWELDDETRYTQDEVQFWHTLPPPPPGDE